LFRLTSNGNNSDAHAYNRTEGFCFGASLRLMMDDPSGWQEGDTYTGNDGKTYNTVKIGTRVWTTENLEETQYRNGDVIPNVTDNTTWSNLTTGALCLYNNNLNYACKTPLPTT